MVLLVWPMVLWGKDFGLHGHVFEILEPDLLAQIEDKLANLEQTGALAAHQDTLLANAQEKITHPAPVQGLTRATTPRTFSYDPTITVPYDLKDPKGRIFQKAGTRVNPLVVKPLTKELVFFDGRDPDQVQWVEDQYLTSQRPVKLILTGGKPFTLMETWDRSVFFDQGGILTKKLGIQAVPAVAVQEEDRLRLEEILIPQKKGEKK